MDVIQPSEKQRIQEVADEYRSKGYDVTVEPKKEQLPDFLALYRPDMLVHKDDEFIVVEIKTRADLARSDRMQKLAQTIQEHPGWRLELILTHPDRLTHEELARSFGERDTTRIVQEASTLLESNLTEAALLLAWSATEAALRLLAFREDVVLEKRGPNYLIERLTTEGVISREDYRSLADTLRLQNEVAHGFKADISQAQVQRSLELIQRFLENEL